MNSPICWKLLIINYYNFKLKYNTIYYRFTTNYYPDYTRVLFVWLLLNLNKIIRFIINLITTIKISPIIIKAFIVKMLLNNNNQQITKNYKFYINIFYNIIKYYINKLYKFVYLVGISETIWGILNKLNKSIIIFSCINININNITLYNNNNNNNNSAASSSNESRMRAAGNRDNNHKDNKFNQWLAGLIDGNGYFGVTSKKYPNCEITISLYDEKTLKQIQNKFKGSIKLRSGVKTIRYRLHNKEDIIKLINAVNGNIRNSKRLVQFYKVCKLLDIKPIPPIKLNKNNAWFIGFIDANGIINYSFEQNKPQLYISVCNKYYIDIEYFKNVFNIGNIYFDKSQNGYFKWIIKNEKDIINFYNDYILYNPSRTTKFNRFILIKKFYELKILKAYKSNNILIEINNVNEGTENINSCIYKAWIYFEKKWNNKII